MKQTIILLFAICMALGAQAQTVLGASPFTVPVSGSYIIPAGVTSITVQCWGAGSGGSWYVAGGGGAYASSTIAVTPGSIHNINIGVGGAQGSGPSGSYGGNGGSSSFDSLVLAAGGDNAGGPGLSSACIGTTRYSGGGSAQAGSYFGGGGSAGPGSAGIYATTHTGAAAVTGGGAGGSYDPNTGYGTAGGFPGGGGGGLTFVSNNVGGNGQVIISIGSACAPSVSISCNNTNLDNRTNILFTATPTNGGTRPSYNWYLNGVLITGIHGAVLSYGGALGNGDQIYCTITPSIGCGAGQTATSNTVSFTKSGSSAKEILRLTMPAQVGVPVFNSLAATVAVTVTTPPALRTAIHPISLYTTIGAAYSPSYAVNRDFSVPVTYTVRAQDGSTKVWTVTVLDQSGNKTSNAIEALSVVTDMNIYPNPASAYINVMATGGADVPVITVLDIEGRVMYHQALPITDMINHQVDLSDFAAGSYIMYVAQGAKVQTRQFVVGK